MFRSLKNDAVIEGVHNQKELPDQNRMKLSSMIRRLRQIVRSSHFLSKRSSSYRFTISMTFLT